MAGNRRVGGWPRRWRVTWIDLVGGVVNLALLLACARLIASNDTSAGRDVERHERNIQQTSRELDRLTAENDRQLRLLDEVRRELEGVGTLPEGTPVEEDLRLLAQIATRNGLETVRVMPLAGRDYPGMHETRYSFQLRGRTQAMARMLKGVEEAPCWADVSYLRLQREGADRDGSAILLASLTFSLFSAAPDDAPPTEPRGIGPGPLGG